MIPNGVVQHFIPPMPLSRVELHVHLDGAVRVETAWELSKMKNLELPGQGTLEDFRYALTVHKPKDLQHFLKSFNVFMPAIVGDLDAIRRISFEFCEDVAKNGTLYVEARFCPQLLMDERHPEVTADHIIQAVLEGFRDGEATFGIKARIILCCINGLYKWSREILELCVKYRGEGVVAIDIAGNEAAIAQEGGAEMYSLEEKAIFVEARKYDVHRTVHAGEGGPASNVISALDDMFAERVGHGYRVMNDNDAYARCLNEKIHFEVCPTSSILTGSVSIGDAALLKHPVLKLAKDGANFSINTDDPTVTGTRLDDEFRLLHSWGFRESTFTKATFNAAKSAFLPPDEKRDLIKQLKRAHGIDDDF